jgi:hypothetical protein
MIGGCPAQSRFWIEWVNVESLFAQRTTSSTLMQLPGCGD